MKRQNLKDMTTRSTVTVRIGSHSWFLHPKRSRLSLLIISPSTLFFRQGCDICASTLVPSLTVQWFLFHHDLSLSMCPKQTAADRQWIKTDQMLSFRAADGQRGGWVKGSCLIIQGSSLIMSQSKVQKLILIWHEAEELFYAILIMVAVPITLTLTEICHTAESWRCAFPKIFEKEVIANFLKHHDAEPHTSRFSPPAQTYKVDICIHCSLNVAKLHTIKLFEARKPN